MHDYLKAILANKKREVDELLEIVAADIHHPILPVLAGQHSDVIRKSLRQALLQYPLSVIAEIKRRSPSKAQLAEIMDPVALAKQYVAGGAAAISVLTDFTGFGGTLADLTVVANFLNSSKNNVPVLRKDFILHEVQIAESIVAGADAVLLIVAVLQEQTEALLAAANRMKIEALVEVHTLEELEYAIKIGAEIIGVNNRNLSTFAVDLNCSVELIKSIPSSVVKVTESGIDQPETGRKLAALGFNALLIGESLVKSTLPEIFIRELCSVSVLN